MEASGFAIAGCRVICGEAVPDRFRHDTKRGASYTRFNSPWMVSVA